MRHTAHYCEHGERTDRTTTHGEPICALCRHAAHNPDPVPQPDWQTLRAGDDTWDDDTRPTLADAFTISDAEILAALFSDDARGRRLRGRILASL